MALITLPAIEAVSVRPRLIRGDVPLEKLGGGVVIVAPPYALWTLSIPLATQTLSGNARAWFAALAQLSKLSNTCKIMPPGFVNGANYTGANPLVNGAGQLGLTLAADGLPAFTLVALRAMRSYSTSRRSAWPWPARTALRRESRPATSPRAVRITTRPFSVIRSRGR